MKNNKYILIGILCVTVVLYRSVVHGAAASEAQKQQTMITEFQTYLSTNPDGTLINFFIFKSPSMESTIRVHQKNIDFLCATFNISPEIYAELQKVELQHKFGQIIKVLQQQQEDEKQTKAKPVDVLIKHISNVRIQRFPEYTQLIDIINTLIKNNAGDIEADIASCAARIKHEISLLSKRLTAVMQSVPTANLGQKITVNVRPLTGLPIQISLMDSDTIVTLKNKLEGKEDIPVERQKLIFNGSELTNEHKTLKELNIGDQATIGLQIIYAKLTPKTPAPATPAPATPAPATRVTQKQEEESTIMVFVSRSPDPIIMIDLKSDSTVADLKKEIAMRQHLTSEQQKLLFNQRELTNEQQTLKELGIDNSSTISLKKKEKVEPTRSPSASGQPALAELKKPEPAQQTSAPAASAQEKPVVPEVKLSEQPAPVSEAAKAAAPAPKKISESERSQEAIVIVYEEGIPVIKISINLNKSLLQLKQLLATRICTEPANQMLLLRGTNLTPEDKLLKDFGFVNNSRISLPSSLKSETPIAVPVELPTKEIKSITMCPNATVEDLKNAIYAESGKTITPENQRLKLGNDELVDDAQTLRQNNILATTTVAVEEITPSAQPAQPAPEKSTAPISSTPEKPAPTPKEPAAPAQPAPTKRATQEQLADPANNITVTLNNNNSRKWTFKINTYQTVGDLKKIFIREEGIKTNRVQLIFNKQFLNDDDQTLQEANIVDGSTIFVTLTKQASGEKPVEEPAASDQISVNIFPNTGGPIEVKIKKTDTVATLKQAIFEEAKKNKLPHDFSIKRQELYLRGQKLEAKDDTKTLEALDIRDKTRMSLVLSGTQAPVPTPAPAPTEVPAPAPTPEPTRVPVVNEQPLAPGMIRVEVKRLWGPAWYDIRQDATVLMLKEEILAKEGISVVQQKLFFNGTLLENTKNLASYGIQNGSIIDLIVAPAPKQKSITVNDYSDYIQFTDAVTVLDLKNAIQQKNDIPVILQRLIFKREGSQSRELQDDETLASQGINADSPIILILRGKDLTKYGIMQKITPETTVAALKVMLGEIRRNSPDDLIFIFNGRELESDKKLSYYGINKDSQVKYFIKASKAPKEEAAPASQSERAAEVAGKAPAPAPAPAGGSASITFNVTLRDGTTIPVTVSQEGTVLDLKRAIATKNEGVLPAWLYRIDKYNKNVSMNDNNQNLKQFASQQPIQIVEAKNIVVQISPQNINIERKNINIANMATVGALKKIIQGEFGIKDVDQILIIGGKELSDNNVTLQELGISDGVSIELIEMMTVMVHISWPPHMHIPVKIAKNSTVGQLKQVISQGGDRFHNLLVDEQKLTFGDNTLSDNERVSDVGIVEGSTVRLFEIKK